MSLPKNFEAEFRRVLAEKAGAALLEVLRRQLPSLTFAELQAVLGSPHGKAIESMPVAALVGRGPDVPAVAVPVQPTAVAEPARPAAAKGRAKAKKGEEERVAKATPKKAAKKTAAKAAKKQAKKQAKKSRARTERSNRAGPKGLAMEAAVLEALRGREAPLPSREFRDVLKGAATNTLFRAIQRLIEAGKVQRHGKAPNSSYSLVAGTPVVTATKTGTPAVPPTGESVASGPKKGATKKRSTKKTARASAGSKAKKGSGAATAAKPAAKGSGAKVGSSRVTSRTIEGRKAYDAAILNALRAAGEWVKMSDVRQAVGGSEEQVRIGLRRLAKGGLIQRTGERHESRYKLAG